MILRATTLLLLLALPRLGRGGDLLPPQAEAMLLLRVLGYDRNLAQSAGPAVTVAVAWRTGDEALRDAALEALRDAASHYRVAGLHVRAVPVRWEGPGYASRLREAGACVVLVVGSLHAEAAALTRELREARVLSVAASREAVEAGLSVGLVQQERSARVLINVASARAAGADLDAALFTVAETVGAGPTAR